MWRWDQQEPFGNNPANEDPDANSVAFDLPLRLPGQRYDQETGLHYNYFRDYDPSIGRYGESDPIGLRAALNTYAYVKGRPTSLTDPTGLFSSKQHNEMTTAAIAIAGSSCPNLPAEVALADWRPGSQAPANAHWHAMRDGTNSNATGETAQSDFNNYVEAEWKSCSCYGLAGALHAVQDQFASGHTGFQSWGGGFLGLPTPSHAWHDDNPSPGERNAAVNASVDLMRKFKKECDKQCPK